MEHTMDEQMRTMVEDGTLSEGAYKELLETLGEALKDNGQLFEVKYRHNIVSATSVISNDDDVSGVHLFEDHFIRTTIVTTKEYPNAYKHYDSYSKIFNNHEIAVHNGKAIMEVGDMWTDYNRTECGDVLLLQNTILSAKPYRKRAREE